MRKESLRRKQNLYPKVKKQSLPCPPASSSFSWNVMAPWLASCSVFLKWGGTSSSLLRKEQAFGGMQFAVQCNTCHPLSQHGSFSCYPEIVATNSSSSPLCSWCLFGSGGPRTDLPLSFCAFILNLSASLQEKKRCKHVSTGKWTLHIASSLEAHVVSGITIVKWAREIIQ